MVWTGLVGFGLAGAAFHARLIDAVPRLALGAVVSSKADAVRAAYPDVAVVGDVAALLADPATELVVIATPNPTHAPIARAALEAGKHVVIDKPFALDPVEGAELIALAARAGRMLSVFHNRRWDGDFLTVEALVRGGRLGPVSRAEFCWDRHRAAIKPGWREEAGVGSGLLADLGPHLIDQALRLFGPPDSLSADIVAQRDAALVDDYFELVLRYGTRRAILSASSLAAAPRPRFALHGMRASYVKYGIDPQEAMLRAGGSPGDSGYGVEAPADYGTLVFPDGLRESVPTADGDWRRFYEGVADAILDGAPPPVDPADALTGLRLIACARQSARLGQVLAFA